MEITIYKNGQVFKTAMTAMKNPMTRKGSRVYWNETAGDSYAVTGVSPSGERVKITSPSWHALRGIELLKGTRWLVRANKRWKINSI